MSNARTIRTNSATLSLLAPRLLEQRYLDDAQFTSEAIRENIAAMETLCSHHGPCFLLTVMPRGMKINPALMNDDHYRDERTKGNILALAVVTDSEALHMASKLYFTYHLQPFQLRVFDEEMDALQWLRTQMAAKGAA